MLSKLMLLKSNVLVMDDPTNHLDLESISSLNDGLKNFKGFHYFASHDHEFIQTLANHIIVLSKMVSLTALTKPMMNSWKIKKFRQKSKNFGKINLLSIYVYKLYRGMKHVSASLYKKYESH